MDNTTIKKCLCCRGSFVTKRNPNQKYCSKHKCQLARKNKWRKKKLRNDADYKDNQQRANKKWRDKNPDYWRHYRQSHPGYTERNRKRQREKQRDKRLLFANNVTRSEFAKSDALNDINSIKTGTYRIVPFTDPEFAKSDALIVKISTISDGYTEINSG